MNANYTATGTLSNGDTVRLDQALPTVSGRVRLMIEVEAPAQPTSILEAMKPIWDAQIRRGHVPPTAEEVEEYIRRERESWND
jgi:hypothetical protein